MVNLKKKYVLFDHIRILKLDLPYNAGKVNLISTHGPIQGEKTPSKISMAPCAILRIFNDVLLSYLMYSKVLKVDHFICK